MKLFPQFISRSHTRRLGAAALVLAFTAGAARADLVFDWNEALVRFCADAANPLAPHLEARAYAMTHLAMDEAIAEASRGTRAPDARIAAQRAAAASAARIILAELLPSGAARFEALASAQLAAVPDSAEKVRGTEAGRMAAAVVLSRRDRDGWIELAAFNPPAGPAPDRSPQAASALLAGEPAAKSPWLEAKPFILKTAHQVEAVPPYILNHEGQVIVDLKLRNARMFAAVDRDAAVTAVERNWAGRPFGTWNRIARSAGERATLDLAGEARLLVVLNLALADTTLSVLHWRHELGTWRAVTVEVWNSLHGMPPPPATEVVLVQTEHGSELARRDMQRVLLPPMLNFPAPVAALAGAAQAAITGILKNDRTPLVLPEASPKRVADALPPRVMANVSAAGRECAFVASLDGRHSREACVSGYELGAAIGSYVAKRSAARR